MRKRRMRVGQCLFIAAALSFCIQTVSVCAAEYQYDTLGRVTVAPAFDKIELGIQYKSPITADVLLKRKIIKKVGNDL